MDKHGIDKLFRHNRAGRCLPGIVVVWALIAWIGGAHAQTETSIQVQVNQYTVVFGQHIRFHLEVSSVADIRSIVLAYRTADTPGTSVQRLTFEPARQISVDYIHEIAQHYIRPFVEVTYWWTIEDSNQTRLITPSQTFVYEDNRFEWQTLSHENVRVHWYRGDLETVQVTLNTALSGLNRARQDIGLEQTAQVLDIYMYATPGDLNVALPLPARSEALTIYETGVILTAFAPEAVQLPKIKRVVPHEVTHALIHAATQNDQDRVPAWFAEGLATSLEYAFVPNPEAGQLLAEAVRRHETLPLETLCAGFPVEVEAANLAYAQSASLIDYIRDVYGRQALRDLLAAYADGATCGGGVQRVLGISLERLEYAWLDSLLPHSGWVAFWVDNAPWLILLVLTVGIPFLFVLRPQAGQVQEQ